MLKIMEISHIKRKRKNMNSPCPSKSANFDVMGGNSTITLYCVNENLGKRRREDVVDDLLQVTMGTSSLMLEETQAKACSSGDNLNSHKYSVGVTTPGKEKRAMKCLSLTCDLGDVWVDGYAQGHIYYARKTAPYGLEWSDVESMWSEGYHLVKQLSISVEPGIPNLAYRGPTGVLLAFSRTHNKRVAVKYYTNGFNGTRGSQLTTSPEEVKLLRKTNHTNIVRFLSAFCVPTGLCMVTEFCQTGSLQNLLSSNNSGFITNQVARRYFSCVLNAVDYLHTSMLIAHRGITAENLVIDSNDSLKLCGFTSSVQLVSLSSTMRDLRPGLDLCYPPEVEESQVHQPAKVDMWQLGCLLCHMLTGRQPFCTKDNGLQAMLVKMKRETPSLPQPEVLVLKESARELLRGLLRYLVPERWSLKRIRFSAWMTEQKSAGVSIGNYHRVRQPQKCKDGEAERRWKDDLEI